MKNAGDSMQYLPDGFIKQIDSDIHRIETCLENKCNLMDLVKLHREIDSKYQACVKLWMQGLWGAIPKFGINLDMLDENSVIENLQAMKSKLDTYRYGINAIPNTVPASTNISVQVNNNIDLKLTFEDARKTAREATSLTADQIEELIQRIDFVEGVLNTSEPKKNKWDKIRPILTWLADKSFDVGMVLLPLILKAQG